MQRDKRPAERRLPEFADSSQDVLWIALPPFQRLDYLSPAFEGIWGREREAVMEDPELWLRSVHPDDRRRVRRAHARAQAGERAAILYRIRRPDGTIRWMDEAAFPIAGPALRIGGIARDITARRQEEEAREQAAARRELLLREIDHRAKNSFQMVMALLHLQATGVDDPAARAQLDEASLRVAAIADIHASLNPTEGTGGQLAVGDYLRKLCARLGAAVAEEGRECTRLTVVADDGAIAPDRALPLGLIVNELVGNALRHAFPGPARGEIRVSFTRPGAGWRLEVRDTGPGLPLSDEAREGGSGRRLVELLVKQLRGTLHVGRDAGTVVTVEAPA